VDTEVIKTDSWKYTLPIWKKEETIIVVNDAPKTALVGETISIQYTPYDKNEYVNLELIYPEN
jgi:hypothetical protein